MSKKMVTLNELLEIKDFAERVTLVNKHGNLNNQITHVTIMEGPDLHEWVTGGEFVLTTWYAFSKSCLLYTSREHYEKPSVQRKKKSEAARKRKTR